MNDAGWYRDPSGTPNERWWDGGQWTSATKALSANSPGSPGSSGPAKSGLGRILLIGIGAAAFLLFAFLGLGVVLALQDDDSNDNNEQADAEQPAETVMLDESAVVLGNRCGFDPAPNWTRLDDSDFIANFSLDPNNPVTEEPERGEPGVYLELRCQSNDGLTPIENEFGVQDRLAQSSDLLEIVEQSEVELSGEPAIASVLRFTGDSDGPGQEVFQTTVVVGDSRCGFDVVATEGRIAEMRAELNTIFETLICSPTDS